MISSVFPASDTISSVCIIPSLRRNFWTHAGLYPSPDGFNEVLLQPTSSPFRRHRFEAGRTRQDNQVSLLRQILLRRPCRRDMQDRPYVYGMRVYLAEPRKLYTAQMPLLQVHRMERQPEAGGVLCEVRSQMDPPRGLQAVHVPQMQIHGLERGSFKAPQDLQRGGPPARRCPVFRGKRVRGGRGRDRRASGDHSPEDQGHQQGSDQDGAG